MKKYLFISLSLLCTIQMSGQTQVIAHRGFWKTNGSAENSITALIKADSIGCYGSEFDVWLTKDNKLIVNHDPVIQLKAVQKSSAASLTKLKLSNGEHLPTLAQYLEKGKTLKTRLILELKPHNSPERETLAIEKILDMVKSMELENRIEYITFSLHATKEFIRLAPAGTPVYNLDGKLSPRELKEMGCAGPDYHISVFQKNPEWISECHQLGLKVNVWTVNKKDEMQWLINQAVEFITTNEPVLLQSLLGNQSE